MVVFKVHLGQCAPNKKGTPKGELTLRTSVITHGSKGELTLRGTFLFGAHGHKTPFFNSATIFVRKRPLSFSDEI